MTSAAARPSVRRVVILVMDSVGAGASPDAADYGDTGAHTLGNVARHVGGLRLPNLAALGLGNVTPIEGVPPTDRARGGFGKMRTVTSVMTPSRPSEPVMTPSKS